MRIKETEYREVTEKKEVVIKEEVVCNKCGKEFHNVGNYIWDAEVHNFNVSFGYGSIYDGEQWSFDLCEDCLTEIIKTFKYVPNGFRLYDLWLTDDEHQEIFEHWKKTGEWEELLCASYDQIVSLKGYFETEYLNEAIKKFHPGKPLLNE